MIAWNQAEMKPLEEFIDDCQFFHYMVEDSNATMVSFIPDETIAEYLDMDYFYNRSGRKIASTLVSRISDEENYVSKLAKIVVNRYKAKWEQLFARYADMETKSLLNNINLTTKTSYGKKNHKEGDDSLTKIGDEVHTLDGTETREESFPSARKTTREITGGWKDTDTTSTTRTGVQDVEESYPVARTSTKTTSGTYSDADSTATTRTGSTKVTDKGDTLTSRYGFNSPTPVGVQKVGPDDSTNGLTQETTYGESGLKDQRSGDITRSYNNFQEATVESGSTKVSTTFGENGLKDENAGDVERTYQNYKDEVQESGSKLLTIGFGQNGKTDTLSFDGRSDTREYSEDNELSGTDTITEEGYNYRRDEYLQQYLSLFSSAGMIDFIEIVFDDVDNVLTLPIFA